MRAPIITHDAREYAAQLRASRDTLYADGDYAAFDERQRAFWDALAPRGNEFKRRVLDYANRRS